MFLHNRKKKQFLLVEPVAKTPYPPLGLMKISSMLKKKYPGAEIFTQVGPEVSTAAIRPDLIYVTSLFTWDLKKVVTTINGLKRRFPDPEIAVGGIAASLMPEYIRDHTGLTPQIGLLREAEDEVPDYSLNFGRKLKTSITFTTRGCIRNCNFCTVKSLEPDFTPKSDWEKDINLALPMITFWDNNWLASPNLEIDIKKLQGLNKKVDFNQGMDARLYTSEVASLLSTINIDPIRFAFDDINQESLVLRAINEAKKYSKKEITVYVLYNFNDSPEEFYYKVNLLNKEKVLSFPMGYRPPVATIKNIPNKHWNEYLLRALKLSLLFYYRKGMITESRESFLKIYGDTPQEFISNLYRIYDYDKSLKRSTKGLSNA